MSRSREYLDYVENFMFSVQKDIFNAIIKLNLMLFNDIINAIAIIIFILRFHINIHIHVFVIKFNFWVVSKLLYYVFEFSKLC